MGNKNVRKLIYRQLFGDPWDLCSPAVARRSLGSLNNCQRAHRQLFGDGGGWRSSLSATFAVGDHLDHPPSLSEIISTARPRFRISCRPPTLTVRDHLDRALSLLGMFFLAFPCQSCGCSVAEWVLVRLLLLALPFALLQFRFCVCLKTLHTVVFPGNA